VAQGDVVFFDQWLVDVAEAKQDHETGVFFIGLVTNATVPAATTADPRWGAGGTTNFKTNEVTPGGNYVADGASLANPSVTLGVGDNAEIDWDDPATWSQHASNPTDATWGIIYNNQAAKECVGYVDLGGAFDMTTGDLTITFGTPVATLDQA
jgi:hypothetical protein